MKYQFKVDAYFDFTPAFSTKKTFMARNSAGCSIELYRYINKIRLCPEKVNRLKSQSSVSNEAKHTLPKLQIIKI